MTDKVALITGGNSGIGLATASVRGGRRLRLHHRAPQKELDAAVAAIGKNVTGIVGDVAKLADLDRVIATIEKQKGRLDIVFANAGVAAYQKLGEITEDEYHRHFDINVKGALFTVPKSLPLLRDGGAIILTSSVVGVKGLGNNAVYSATKAALRSFARTFTTDLKVRKIRVNVVSPGPILPPGLEGLTGRRASSWTRRLQARCRSAAPDEPRRSPRPSRSSRPMPPATSPAPSSSSTAASRRYNGVDALLQRQPRTACWSSS